MNVTEQKTSSLAERALLRLRKLATGNGLQPAAIVILETQENIFTLKGKMEVSPLYETEPTSYSGGVKSTDRKMLTSAKALQAAIIKHREEFRENPDWITATTAEIIAHESQGWGLENAKVTLPKQSVVYAVTEVCGSCNGRQTLTCTQCHGQGTLTCTQCQGRGREQCYYCGGRGENPHQPGQPCTTCNGTRFAPCRFCQTQGHLPCPTCQGRRGTPCTTCQATGKITNEVAVTCGAETHFKLISEELPSGLRRGLERVGIANLGKGHADITTTPPPEQEQDEASTKTQIPILNYQAVLPYAELRMGFGEKKAIVSVLGKRCAISGVPNFLDTSLQPARDKLHQAALGKASLEEAIEARALNEALSLTVAGKGRVEEVRKLYPFGLSPEVMNSILADIQLALNKTTFKTRIVIALMCGGLCSTFFYMFFTGGLEASFTKGWKLYAEFGMDLAVLALALGASWMILNFSTRFVLQKRFPRFVLALQQKIGKTGFAMHGSIIGIFVAVLFMMPVKPLWISLLAR